MTIQEQKEHLDEVLSQMTYLLLKKGNDYANEDRLSNFKLAGSIAGGNAATNCLNMIATKVARLGNLLTSDKIPVNESINDSVIDLANYAVLLHMILNEGDTVSTKVDPINLPDGFPIIDTKIKG